MAKVTFGAEPKDSEVLELVLKHYYELKFSLDVETKSKHTADNPNCRQRNARKQLNTTDIDKNRSKH